MPRTITGICISVAMLLTVGCASTRQLDGPADPAAGAIGEVLAPETLETFAPPDASDAPANSEVAAGIAGVEPARVSAAARAFVDAAPFIKPRPSPGTQPAPRFGPGVTDDVIRIGAPLRLPVSAYAPLYPETVRPDFRRVWQVVVNAVNSTGGIMNRRLEPVFLPNEPNPDQICTFFTEEEEVIAVSTDAVPDAAGCLGDAGVATIAHAYALWASDYQEASRAVAPMGITHERANQLYIDGLYQQGFFAGDHKIGLIRWDTPQYAELSDGVVKPALARYGLEIDEEVLISDVKNQNQVSNAQADGWSGVGTFKDAGVDRVLTLDNASYILPEFTDYAEKQSYYPRYGLNSLIGGEWDMERNQLKGAVGIGWMPWVDLEPDDAYRHGSEGGRRCVDLMIAAGEEKQVDTYNEAIWTSSICDAVLLLKAAVEAGAPSITADSIVSGAETLGTSFQSANTLVTRFGPGRHEGVAAIRFLRWFVGCECFRYTSDLFDAG